MIVYAKPAVTPPGRWFVQATVIVANTSGTLSVGEFYTHADPI